MGYKRQKKKRTRRWKKKYSMKRNLLGLKDKKHDRDAVETEQGKHPEGDSDKQQGNGTTCFPEAANNSEESKTHERMDDSPTQMQHQSQHPGADTDQRQGKWTPDVSETARSSKESETHGHSDVSQTQMQQQIQHPGGDTDQRQGKGIPDVPEATHYSKESETHKHMDDSSTQMQHQTKHPEGDTYKRQGKGTPDVSKVAHNFEKSETHKHFDDSQTQMQKQIQRRIEASKQMLFGVFGNVITILEEYERRELASIYNRKQAMPSSDIKIPKQSHKSFDDIKSIVETQLLLFETQTRACPPEAIASVRQELKRHTIGWSAVRAENGIEGIHQTDYFISKLYEIIAKGRTDHKPLERKEVTKEAMKKGVQAILYGENDRQKLDKEFKDDPDKISIVPKTRSSEMLLAGAKRISHAMGDGELDRHLENDIKQFEKDGPDDLK